MTTTPDQPLTTENSDPGIPSFLAAMFEPPLRFHTLHPDEHRCETCDDFPQAESRKGHLERTAYRPKASA